MNKKIKACTVPVQYDRLHILSIKHDVHSSRADTQLDEQAQQVDSTTTGF